MATFPKYVEIWRNLLADAAPDLPTDFLLAWINKESAGNMCSFTSYHEAGIFQLMPPDNTRDGGTTEEALRAACNPGVQTFARDPTADEKMVQITSGVRYVRHVRDVARKRLAAVGANWSESSADFWSMVKLVHTLPSLLNGLEIAKKALGRAPANWAEFVQNGAQNLNGASKWLPFAAGIGAYGAGFLASPLTALTSISGAEIVLTVLGLAAGTVGAIYFNRWLGEHV